MADETIGVFIGLSSSSYEYIANITAPYKANFSIELGSFLLITEAPNTLVARVIDFIPQGELISFMGQKWLSDMATTPDAIGSDIKKRKISYSVKIKILGSFADGKFNAGLRKIPHITSKVVKPDTETITKILDSALSEQKGGVKIGDYFLDSKIPVKFNLAEMEAKRTFIFARAGFGKSNLMKIIASDWGKPRTTNEEAEGLGGLLIFDPDGEYALTDKKLRTGIMDKKEAILITNRKENQDTKNIYRNLRLNLKDFRPQFILPIIIPPEKHENIFFSKLMGLNSTEWGNLVDLIYAQGWRASFADILNAMYAGSQTDADEDDMKPVRNNLVRPIQTLHDPDSKLMQIVESALRRGAVIIFDVSLLGQSVALWLSSLIVKYIFDKNQENFVNGSRESMIRATFVIDEAQSVLSKDDSDEAFVSLAKEGRKYQLGGVFITQQPSSIPIEILSQADNFFVFHLLSRGDLDSLQRANAHYSNDAITQILNEPTKGKCYMWTSAQPFVLPVQIGIFEDPHIVNKSKDVQNNSTLLSGILGEVLGDATNPTFSSILTKYSAVERELAGKELKERTAALFRKLDDSEKTFLRGKGAIQSYQGTEFALKFNYYTNTLAVLAKSEDNE